MKMIMKVMPTVLDVAFFSTVAQCRKEPKHLPYLHG